MLVSWKTEEWETHSIPWLIASYVTDALRDRRPQSSVVSFFSKLEFLVLYFL
jgi:hypothetical protein